MARRGAIAALWDAVHLAGKAAMQMLRAPTGEAGLARMIGSYGGGSFGGSLSKAEQVQHFRGWNYRCIDYICSRIAKEPPCAVLAADPKEVARHKLKTKAYLRGKGSEPEPRAWASPMWRQKAHGPAKPNEEYEFLGDDHPLVRLLQDPNDPETGVSFWYELELFSCLTGEDYTWVVEGDDGRPAELWCIPSHWVRPVCLGRELLVDYYEVSPRGGSAGLVRFDPDEIIWCRKPSPLSKLIGASTLQAMATTADSYEMVEAARYFSMQNGATVGGTIQVPPGTQLTPETITRLESRFAAKYVGVKNFNRPIILEGGAQWVPAPAEQELAHMQTIDQLRTHIMAHWGLDEVVLGFGKGGNRAGNVASAVNVGECTINPRRRTRAATFTEKLARRFDPKARIFYPDDSPLDPDAVRNDFSAGGALNAVSANDYRTHVLGLEPWEEGIYDRPLISPGLANPVDTSDWDEEHEGDDTNELRGTVGGLQAISGMQQQFYAGTIPREAAVAAMQTLFGMSPEEAEGLFPQVDPVDRTPDGKGPDDQGTAGSGEPGAGTAAAQPDGGATSDLAGALDDGQDPFAGLVDDATLTKAWAPGEVDYTDPAPYGYCPECRTPGVAAERRIDGNAHCANGHAYPRNKAKYACAMAAVSGAAGKKLLTLAKTIPDADLGDDGRESEPHVTVRYGLHAAGPETVAAVLKNAGPIRMTLGNLSAFRGADSGKPYDVIFADVESPDLHRLNALLKVLPHTDTWATYKPHATVAYVKAGLADKYLALLGGVNESCTATQVDFATADRRHFAIPLGRPKKIVGRWFRKDHGPPPFEGGVFDESRHRWVKPHAGDDPGNVHHAALAEHMPPEVFETPGLWDRVKDAAATVAAKAYTKLVSATPAVLKVVSALEGVIDTPDDLKKFGYNPTLAPDHAGNADPLKQHAGISTHLACTVASHVLGRASLWARKKLTGKDTADGWTGAAELIAEVLAGTNAALGLEGVPGVEQIAAGLKELAASTKAAKPKRTGPPGPPPRPGLVWNESSRRWTRDPSAKPKKDEPKKPDKAQVVDAANKFLAGDGKDITPEQLGEFGKALNQLTVPEIQKLQAAHEARGGKSKADRIAKLVERARAEMAKAGGTKPNLEPAPTTPTSDAAPHKLTAALGAVIGRTKGLSDAQRAEYAATAKSVTGAMPVAALDRAAASLKNAHFHADSGAMVDALLATTKNAKSRATLESVKKRGGVIGGAVTPEGAVHLDGAYKSGERGRHATGKGTTRAIYAHELTHAVDGPEHELSESAAWREAYTGEIAFAKGSPPPLTTYANTKPSEGFAEFGYLLYGSDVPTATIREQFPKASAFFESKGLFPAERGGTGKKVPEVFGERVELDGTGHADVLKTPTGATGTGHPAPTVTDAPRGGYQTTFAPGHEEAAAKKYGRAVAREIHLGAIEGDGIVTLGKVAALVKRQHPEATDADVMAAASWLHKAGIVDNSSMTEVQHLGANMPLNGGTDPKTSTLWQDGRAMHYWMANREGGTERRAADAIARIGGDK